MIDIKVEVSEAIERGEGLPDAMRQVAAIMYLSVMRGFDTGGYGAWPPLKKGGTSHLRKDGILAGSIVYESDGTRAIVGTNVDYSTVHQFGWGTRNIPPREFMVFQQQDIEDIRNAIGEGIKHKFHSPKRTIIK